MAVVDDLETNLDFEVPTESSLRCELKNTAMFWWSLSIVENIISHLIENQIKSHPVLSQLTVVLLLISFLCSTVVLGYTSLSVYRARILINLTVLLGISSLILLGVCAVRNIIGVVLFSLGVLMVLIISNPFGGIWAWLRLKFVEVTVTPAVGTLQTEDSQIEVGTLWLKPPEVSVTSAPIENCQIEVGLQI